MKRQFSTIVLFVLAFLALPVPLFAAADFNGGVLTVTGVGDNDEIQLQVGPAPGEVVVLKAPGVVDGTRFTGVHHIYVASGPGSADKVEIKAELNSDLAITLETERGGDVIKLDMKTLAGALNVSVNLIGNTGYNKLEWLVDSQSQVLGLGLAANTLAGIDELILKVEADNPSQRLAVNLVASTGTSDDKIEAVLKSAASVVDLDIAANTNIGSDNVKVELSQLAPGTITADFNLDLSGSSDSGEIIVKGSSNTTTVVNGLISGGQGGDSLKLLVEGTATGAPVIDGGADQDSCSVSLGTIVNC